MVENFLKRQIEMVGQKLKNLGGGLVGKNYFLDDKLLILIA